MLTSGDVVDLDLGPPRGREAGFRRPAVVVTADAVLEGQPSVIHVVPSTTTLRGFSHSVLVEPDDANGFDQPSSIECMHIRSIARDRVEHVRGNVGPAVLAQVRSVVGVLLDL